MRTATRHNIVYDDTTWTVTATYGIDQIGNQNPYFSLSGDAVSTEGDEQFGQIQDILLTAFPWLSLMDTVHLRNAVTGEPLYAVENSWFWFTAKDDFPNSWDDMSPAERAAAYLNCDPVVFDGVAADDKAEFINRVESLKPAWKALADAAITTYRLD